MSKELEIFDPEGSKEIVSAAETALQNELNSLKVSKGNEFRVKVLEMLLPSLEKIRELAYGEVRVWDGETVYTKEADLRALTYITNLCMDILGREERLVKEVRLEKKYEDMIKAIYKQQVTTKGKTFGTNPDGSIDLNG